MIEIADHPRHAGDLDDWIGLTVAKVSEGPAGIGRLSRHVRAGCRPLRAYLMRDAWAYEGERDQAWQLAKMSRAMWSHDQSVGADPAASQCESDEPTLLEGRILV
jgi:hypothetical protein